jgi:hypothetical protein
MKSHEASTVIDAAPERVWAVLTDGGRYGEWDAGARVDGRIAAGEKLKVTSEANPGRAFPVNVTEFAPPRRMTWTGGMPLGLFRGVRTFRLEPQGADATVFTMREEYTGPLLPLIWRTMPDLQPSFTRFAEGLKARAQNETSLST